MPETAVPEIGNLIREVQALLNAKCRRRSYGLKVPKNGYRIEEDWITIVVAPSKGHIRAYDYVEILSAVEDELRARGHQNLVLVPAMAG